MFFLLNLVVLRHLGYKILRRTVKSKIILFKHSLYIGMFYSQMWFNMEVFKLSNSNSPEPKLAEFVDLRIDSNHLYSLKK